MLRLAMARGESNKTEPRSGAMGAWAAFLVLVLCVVLFVAFTTRSCMGLTDEPTWGSPTFSTTMLGELRWRDCGPEPQLVNELASRGYWRVAEEAVRGELPLTVTPRGLDERCGLLVFRAMGTSSLTEVAVEGQPGRDPCTPGVVAVAVCGHQPVRATGVGQVVVEEWRLTDGLRPDEVSQLGLPTEVALAHAEAERLLYDRGYSAGRQVIRAPSTGGLSLGARPTDGCVPFVFVATDGRTPHMGLAAACADGTDDLPYVPHPREGGPSTFYVRAYSAGHGPVLTSEGPRATPMSGVTVASWADAELPPPVPSSLGGE